MQSLADAVAAFRARCTSFPTKPTATMVRWTDPSEAACGMPRAVDAVERSRKLISSRGRHSCRAMGNYVIRPRAITVFAERRCLTGALSANGQVEVPGGGQLEIPAPRAGSASFGLGSSSCSGMFHVVRVAVGDHVVAVDQNPVDDANGGGVIGQEPAEDSTGQCDPTPRDRRSLASPTNRSSSPAAVSSSGGARSGEQTKPAVLRRPTSS